MAWRLDALQQNIPDTDDVAFFQNTKRGMPIGRILNGRMATNGRLKFNVRETVQAGEVQQVIPANA
jgi:hypothetical protein